MGNVLRDAVVEVVILGFNHLDRHRRLVMVAKKALRLIPFKEQVGNVAVGGIDQDRNPVHVIEQGGVLPIPHEPAVEPEIEGSEHVPQL